MLMLSLFVFMMSRLEPSLANSKSFDKPYLNKLGRLPISEYCRKFYSIQKNELMKFENLKLLSEKTIVDSGIFMRKKREKKK
jgi:hypothetical protein